MNVLLLKTAKTLREATYALACLVTQAMASRVQVSDVKKLLI